MIYPLRDIPSDDFSSQLLMLIYRRGGQMNISDSYGPMAEALGIDQHGRMLTRAEYYGDNRSGSAFENRVQQARRGLIHDGFLERFVSRGILRLKPKGRDLAQRLERIRLEPKTPLKRLIESQRRKKGSRA